MLVKTAIKRKQSPVLIEPKIKFVKHDHGVILPSVEKQDAGIQNSSLSAFSGELLFTAVNNGSDNTSELVHVKKGSVSKLNSSSLSYSLNNSVKPKSFLQNSGEAILRDKMYSPTKSKSSDYFKITSLEKFDSIFTDDENNVEQGFYHIEEFGAELYTTSVATCLGIVAKGYLNNNIVKIGLVHFDGIDPSLSDFFRECSKGSDKVELHVFGGYDTFNNKLLYEIMRDFDNIFILNEFINPWKMPEDYTKYERQIDEDEYGLKVGITEFGDILVTDESVVEKEIGNEFSTFKYR